MANNCDQSLPVVLLYQQATMAGQEMGHLYLQPTNGQKIDACLVLEENSRPGQPVFTNLGNIRFTMETAATASDNAADDVVYDSRNISDSDGIAAVHTADDGRQQNQQQPDQHARRNRRQHTRRHSVANRDTQDDGLTAPGGFSTYYPPRSSNSIWVTKPARHNVIPGLKSHVSRLGNPAQKQTNTGFTSMVTASEVEPAAVKPLHGGRRAGPMHVKNDGNSKGRHDTAPHRRHTDEHTVASDAVIIHYTEHPEIEAVHVGGKRGVSRKRLYKKHPAPLAAPAGGLNAASEYQQLISSNDSRMRLGVATAAQPEEVIGAMPDQPSSRKKRAGSNADNMASYPSGEPQEHDKVSEVRKAQRGKAVVGKDKGQQGDSSTSIAKEIRRRYLKPTAAMRATEREALREAGRRHARQHQQGGVDVSDVSAAWQSLRLRNNWPDGQTKLESMFSPYHVEMIDECRECQPEL